jgi:hypothetical protein
VTLRGSERASVLIHGEVEQGSLLSAIKLEGGDEDRGIVQQNLPLAGVVPEVSEGTPPDVLTANELYAIPVRPAVPTGD